MSWDLDRLARLAGLNEGYGSTQLNESYDDDDDDDEDPDVKAAMDEAKKRKIKLPKADVDAEKDLTKISGAKKSAEQEKKEEAKEKAEATERAKQKAAEEKEEPKAAESDEDDDEDDVKAKHEASETKAEEKAEHSGKTPSKADEKKETPAEEKKEEAKRRGKAPSADSKRQRLHAHMKANPTESRKNLLAWAQENLNMGSAYASQQIQIVRAAIKASATNECYVLRHPTVPSFILHENGAMGMYQWISSDDENRDPLILMTEAAANKVADYLLNFKNQLVDIEHIKF